MTYKRYLCLWLSLLMVFSSLPVYSASYDGSQSGWAEAEIEQAVAYGLTYPAILKAFKQAITREEFCTIVVKLYEKLSGKAAIASKNPFNDTQNPEILKAYGLGIVKGVSATSFSPRAQITRQEICVMIYRALSAANLQLKEPSVDFAFSDKGSIASWAYEAMHFAFENNIMKGLSDSIIGPKQNTTREQAIVLLKRTYEGFMTAEPAVGSLKYELGRLPLRNVQKILAFNPELSPIFSRLEPAATVFVASGSQKPSVLPVVEDNRIKDRLRALGLEIKPSILDQVKPTQITLPLLPLQIGASRYTEASFSAFVDMQTKTTHWFSYRLKPGIAPSKLIYQVSTAPYTIDDPQWQSPDGLVFSGQLSPSTKEFQVDFSKLNTQKMNFTIPVPRKVYHVRVIPVDALGKALGYPGEGVAVIAGKTTPYIRNEVIQNPDFELWTPNGYIGSYSGEFQDKPTYRTQTGYSPKDLSGARLFHYHNLPNDIDTLIIQVSTKPFKATQGDWTTETNLIYSKSYTLPTTAFKSQGLNLDSDYPASVLVPFADFGTPAGEMTPEQYTKYYVRGIALRTALEPGKVEALFSQGMEVKYGFGNPVQLFSDSPYDKTFEIDRSIPDIKILRYVPVQWQDPEAYQYYIVDRAPKAHEITNRWVNSSNEILYPYISPYIQQYAAKGIQNATQYEAMVSSKFLPVGAKVYFPKPEEKDKAWYEQLYDGIVDFFSDLVNVVSTIVNQVKKAYDDFKLAAIKALVSLCPVDSLKGHFQVAITMLVDSGLAAMGLPPSLPNFDELLKGNMEYLAMVALTEAGVPASELANTAVDVMTDEMVKAIDDSNNHASPNPINSPFLKLHPDYQYRPAYLEVEVSNTSDHPTVAGAMDIGVTFEMDYWTMVSGTNGLYLESDNKYGFGSTAALGSSIAYRNHFEYGLNGSTVNYTQGQEAVYDVFDPVVGQKLPILNPGDEIVITIYLTPYDKGAYSRYPGGHNVLPIDFYNMYFSNGNKTYSHFSVNGYFQTPKEYLSTTGMFYFDPKTFYTYSDGGVTSIKVQKPLNTGW